MHMIQSWTRGYFFRSHIKFSESILYPQDAVISHHKLNQTETFLFDFIIHLGGEKK